MQSEIRQCQNCKQNFTIEPDDFSFYEKIKVPPPTFCPECRFQRRMSWRNERSLYKRKCDLCLGNLISVYPRDSEFPVYCPKCWWSDKWDAISYGQDYDFSKSFFEQFKELSKKVPKIGIWHRNVIDSDYSNMCGECKNVYLSISVVLGSENIFYSRGADKSFNIYDSYNIKESDSCYECLEGEKNYNCQYTIYSRNCLDSFLLFDCVNCNNCAFCYNLRNKEYYFKNKKYSKENYFKELDKLNLEIRKSRDKVLKDFEDEVSKKAIHRYAYLVRAVNSIGNSLIDTKNCIYCFDTYNTENEKYCYRTLNNKDLMDVDYAGKAELLYEYNTGALNDYNVKFSYSAMDAVHNGEYTESCVSSKNLFGCISVKKKENIILNKIYNKKEYEEVRGKIINQMNDVPYLDKKGRIYKYGEFFPSEISPFAYNESTAQDFIFLNKTEILEKGFIWKDFEIKNHQITIKSENIPENITELDNDILNQTLECIHKSDCQHRCIGAFRLTKDEFNFYKKHKIPIPNKCYNCRYYERFKKILPLKLWHRKCMKEGCNNEFETSYAPDRPEIIYCESCYNKEIY